MSHHDVIARIDQAVETWVGYTHPPVHPTLRHYEPEAIDAACHRCGGSVGPGEHNDSGCSACRGSSAIADRIVRLGPYHEPLRDWILRTKFGQWHEMGIALGRLLARQLRAAVPGIDHLDPLVVPIPMPIARRVYRGVDHTRLLTDGIRRETGWAVQRLLTRPLEPTQVTRRRSDRRRGVHLRIRRRWSGRPVLDGRFVVLVDDVLTTGGTMRSGRMAIRSVGATGVVGAVVAVTPDAARGPGGAMRAVPGSMGVRS